MAPHLAYLDRELTEAIDTGGRLIVTMPPRHGKSQLISKYTPAWFLGRYPDHRVMVGGYGSEFAKHWGRAARRLIEECGQRYFGVGVSSDSSAADRWDIAGREGGMMTAGTGGSFTGHGANLLIIDDPIKGHEQANSKVYREKTWEWFRWDAYTRLAPGAAVIIVQTRWHEDDLAGRLLGNSGEGMPKWKLVNLPAIADGEDVLGRKAGEALWPQQYSLSMLLELKAFMGSYPWSALYQQRPQPPEGGMFKREWFKIVGGIPLGFGKAVRYWDFGYSQDDGDYTAGVVIQEIAGKFYIDKAVRGQWSAMNRQRITSQVAAMDRELFGGELVTWLPQDPAAGKEVAELEQKRLAGEGFAVKIEPVRGGKGVRAMPLAAALERGDVFLVSGKWNAQFIDELCSFPTGTNDDLVDAASGAFNKVSRRRARFEVGVY